MIRGLGLDTVKVERFASLSPQTLDRLFTSGERDWCEAAQGLVRLQRFAARFAAKEAVAKALGTGISGGITWQDISVVHDGHGKPEALVVGKARERMDELGITHVHLSLTHEREYASAVAILES
ncbi:MAG: holo-[acyl-carrier-protein] synthase [Fibrobacterota bacterium]|jgi:holo-[acyl-carrier protein] synthase